MGAKEKMTSSAVETHKITFLMRKDMFRELKVNAIQNDTNVSTILNQLVEGYLLMSNNNGATTKRKKKNTNEEQIGNGLWASTNPIKEKRK